jgi:hypothetical protein
MTRNGSLMTLNGLVMTPNGKNRLQVPSSERVGIPVAN